MPTSHVEPEAMEPLSDGYETSPEEKLIGRAITQHTMEQDIEANIRSIRNEVTKRQQEALPTKHKDAGPTASEMEKKSESGNASDFWKPAGSAAVIAAEMLSHIPALNSIGADSVRTRLTVLSLMLLLRLYRQKTVKP